MTTYYMDATIPQIYDSNMEVIEPDNPDFVAFLESGGVLVDIGKPDGKVLIISNFQMHMSLAKRGLYAAVLAVIESLPETLHHEALVMFHKTPVAHSNNALVMQILTAVGLDADGQRELFEFALTL